MLHIILTILKIIGIILAALLGILLFVILVVLFVPIGYDARIDNRNDILVKANGWWLFHALHISFKMDGIPSEEKGNQPVLKVLVLGIPILDTSKKKEKAEHVKRSERATSAKVKAERKREENKTITVEPIEVKPQVTTQELSTKEEPIKEINVKEPVQEDIKVEEKKVKTEKNVSKPKKKKAKKLSEKKTKVTKPRISLIDRIRNFVDTIKRKLQNIEDTKKKLEEKIGILKRFIQNEENVNGIKKVFHSVKRILKHLLPNKIKGQVQFGLNDPCATGQALGVMAMLYPYYGKSLRIEPDFTRQVIEGEIYLKGYIQVFTLAIIGIKLLIDANFRKLIKNLKKL